MHVTYHSGSTKIYYHNVVIVADIVLDEEPWLNATTACTFPFSTSQPKHRDMDLAMTSTPHFPKGKAQKYKRIEKYLGQCGNFAYNNLTVTADDVIEELIFNFDVYSCTAQNVTGESANCIGRDIYWIFNLWQVDFDEQNNPSQYVDITFTPLEGPIRFERDLVFEDAPGPRDHWPQCEEVFPENLS